MGTIDRIVRILAALTAGILILTKVFTGAPAIVAGVLGGIFLLTAIFGFCPLYWLFKISSKRKS
jgi:hypothetical protein